jgi:hypothetical protein
MAVSRGFSGLAVRQRDGVTSNVERCRDGLKRLATHLNRIKAARKSCLNACTSSLGVPKHRE